MLIVPTGSRRAGIERTPWLSGVIVVAACGLLGYAGLAKSDAGPRTRAQISEMLAFWEAHPHVAVATETARRFATLGMHARLTELRRTILASSAAPAAARTRADQRRIDSMIDRIKAVQAATPLQRFGLSPESRDVQLAWLSQGLAHADWTQLVFAALLFWLTAPFVEALWGPIALAVFATAATGIGAAVFVLLARAGDAPFAGLWTAAAASTGVFTVHFLWRRVTALVCLPPLLFSAYDIPGLAWSAAIAGLATVALPAEPMSRAALTARGAALVFGVATAALMSVAGVTVRLVGRAGARIDEDSPRFAKRLYESILRRHADPYDGLTEVARVALDRDDLQTAAGAVDELLLEVIPREDDDARRRVVKEFAARLEPDHLSPAAALIAAAAIAGDDAWLADSLYHSAAERGDIDDRSLLQVAALNLNSLSRPREAAAYCEQLLAADRCSPQVTAEARTLLAAAEAERKRWARTTHSTTARPVTGPAPVNEVEHDFGFVGRRPSIREVELQPGDPAVLETRQPESVRRTSSPATVPHSERQLDLDSGGGTLDEKSTD